MLEKSQKRGDRRWRSFTKFMRRLKSDWAEHGWRHDACPCFEDVRFRARRFKDTPCRCSNPTCCGNPRSVEGAPKRELRQEEVVRERWGQRERSGEKAPKRLQCLCGYTFGWVDPARYTPDRFELRKRCPNCKKKD